MPTLSTPPTTQEIDDLHAYWGFTVGQERIIGFPVRRGVRYKGKDAGPGEWILCDYTDPEFDLLMRHNLAGIANETWINPLTGGESRPYQAWMLTPPDAKIAVSSLLPNARVYPG